MVKENLKYQQPSCFNKSVTNTSKRFIGITKSLEIESKIFVLSSTRKESFTFYISRQNTCKYNFSTCLFRMISSCFFLIISTTYGNSLNMNNMLKSLFINNSQEIVGESIFSQIIIINPH